MSENTAWTRFMDMSSGGSTKQPPYAKILIEAPEEEAKIIFYNRFGHNPDRVTCTCCGSDYSISEADSLHDLTGFDRNCICMSADLSSLTGKKYSPKWSDGMKALRDKYPRNYLEEGEALPEGYVKSDRMYGHKPGMSLEAYLQLPTVLVIRAADIKPEERIGSVPEQGYVWR